MAKTKVIADSAPRLDPHPSPVTLNAPPHRGLVTGDLRLGATA